jgi:hypothetical protein
MPARTQSFQPSLFVFLITLLAAMVSLPVSADGGALQVNPASLSMNVGDSATLAVTNASGRIRVSVGDDRIATVAATGTSIQVRAVKAGATRLTVKDQLSSRSVQITVNSAATLTVAPTSLAVAVGGTGTIAVTNASGAVTATSSDPSVAAVSYANGSATITGNKAGNAVVTIADAKTRRAVAVTVRAALALSPSFVSLTAGATAPLLVSNATGTVTITSSDASVATATLSGATVTVKAVKAGAAAITARDSVSAAVTQISVISGAVAQGGFALLAWNDLGMHCIDGRDYSIFSILPPYNNLHAQLVDKSTGKQVTTGVTLTYEAIADSTVPPGDPLYGSINTSSAGKTNFWDYAWPLFGATPAPEVGLNLSGAPGNRMASRTPQPMSFAPANGWFVAEGIPITPVDDNGVKNFYPMVKVVAKDASGKVLATARTVLPVSDEMTCVACHASTNSTNKAANAARPVAGWVNDPVPDKDWKKNILLLHDERMFADAAKGATYRSALAAMQYDAAGLYPTATRAGGEPVLCAACHSSNALGTGGFPGVRALTHALHTQHANVQDPATMLSLSAINNRTTCYACHPGSVTQCLRGAMGNATDGAGNLSIDCQSCHGNMAAVGNPARTGWLSQPTCQSCHHDGVRELIAAAANGQPKAWADTRFASNPNVPANGFSLYRFSKGHGNLQCEACHGATHAEYPSSHSQDNALSLELQGHAGPVAECAACHTKVPLTTNGGPHGMHTTGDAWVQRHEDVAKTDCTACHGADYRGSPLSAIKVAKTINKKRFAAGHQVSCYDCHNGPNPD